MVVVRRELFRGNFRGVKIPGIIVLGGFLAEQLSGRKLSGGMSGYHKL